MFVNETDDAPQNLTLPVNLTFNDGHVVLIACYTVIFFVALIGNLCVIKAIISSGRKRRKSRVNMMLFHLALADLIVTLVMVPVEIGRASTVQWVAGDSFCRIFAFFRIFGHYLSSFVLVCISIDRYFAVVHPLSLNVADRRGKMMILWSWLLAISCSLPQVVIFHVDNHPQYKFYYQCVTFGFFPSRHHEMAYNIFCLLMLYLVPLTIIVISYGAILITIFKKSRSADDSKIRRSGLGYLGRARIRTIQMTVSIVLAFFVCWTPYVVISLWFCFDRNAAAKLDVKIQNALFIFACTNSCANPLVYGIFNFCAKPPKRVQTWRSATQSTNHFAHHQRKRLNLDTKLSTRTAADQSCATELTVDLIPKSITFRSRSPRESSDLNIEMKDSPITHDIRKEEIFCDSSSRKLTNGSYFSSPAQGLVKGSIL